MDLISIVVAVYNAEKTLTKCVDSLLMQTYDNFEIILVEDCSNDNSLGLCKEYEKNNANIFVVSNSVNCGVSVTRNKGIEVSRGKLICFIDSDDYVETDYLKELYHAYKKYNTVPICGFTYYNEVENILPQLYQWSEGEDLVSLGKVFQLNDELLLPALWNKLFDNDLIKKHNISFVKNLSMGEDLRFVLEYFEKTEIEAVYVLSKPLYNYIRQSENSLMSSFGINGIEYAFENLAMIRKIAEKYNECACEIYEKKVTDLENNFIYFISRDKGLSDVEKLRKIRRFRPQYSWRNLIQEKFKVLKEKIIC